MTKVCPSCFGLALDNGAKLICADCHKTIAVYDHEQNIRNNAVLNEYYSMLVTQEKVRALITKMNRGE